MAPDIRKSIRAAVARQKLTANQLAVKLAGKVSRSQVFDFLNGEHDLTTEKASHLFAELGLKIVEN